MANLNKVMLIGRLGRDPEIRYSQQGLAIVNFSIATSEQWTDKNTGNRQDKTEWHRVAVFGKQAETCEKYLSKGSQIYIEGRLQTRSYEKDGQTCYATEIIVSNFQFLGGKQENHDNGSHGSSGFQKTNQIPDTRVPGMTRPGITGGSQNAHNDGMFDDDIPF